MQVTLEETLPRQRKERKLYCLSKRAGDRDILRIDDLILICLDQTIDKGLVRINGVAVLMTEVNHANTLRHGMILQESTRHPTRQADKEDIQPLKVRLIGEAKGPHAMEVMIELRHIHSASPRRVDHPQIHIGVLDHEAV